MHQILSLSRKLTVFMLVVGSLVSGLAWCLVGVSGLLGSLVSLVFTLLFGILSIAVFNLVGERHRVAAVMAGTNLRLLGTLGVVLLAKWLAPEWGVRQFYSWLLIDYMACLAWETRLLMSGAHLDWSWLVGQSSVQIRTTSPAEPGGSESDSISARSS